MNVNLIRIHCHFENPEFYDLADERGLLLWQDFLEAWYPHDPDFSPHAAALFDNHIRMVRNHASIAVWAPSDEESLENYWDLSKHLAARASLLDPQNRWVQRSTGRWGDAHLYHGWYDGSIWDYARMEENLVTELGATALPYKESLDRFLQGKWPMTAHAADWKYHRLQILRGADRMGRPERIAVSRAVDREEPGLRCPPVSDRNRTHTSPQSRRCWWNIPLLCHRLLAVGHHGGHRLLPPAHQSCVHRRAQLRARAG